jgi:hypothetical protein
MAVKIESAGTHFFDLGHLKREGGETLVRRLLAEAGLDVDLPWRLQVQKKLFCNSETPPVRVVDEPKRWAVYLKIKPGDNNSCHYCSLIMPDGMRGEEVYELLRQKAFAFDRNWRYSAVEYPIGSPSQQDPVAADAAGAAATESSGPAPGAANGEGSVETMRDKSPTRGWLDDGERTRLLLLTINEVDQTGSYPQDRFVELLVAKMNWERANRHEVGGVFTSLVRRGYIIRKFRGSKPYGYELSEEGRAMIEDLLRAQSAPAAAPAPPPPAPTAAPAPAEPDVDPAAVIRSFAPAAERLLLASIRLKELDTREVELTAELDGLRREKAELCRLLVDREVQSFIDDFARLRRTSG